jgi:long-chain acyl-CoA synthetase
MSQIIAPFIKAGGIVCGVIISVIDFVTFAVLFLIRGKRFLSYDFRSAPNSIKVGEVKDVKEEKEESRPYRHINFVDHDLMKTPENFENIERMDQLFSKIIERYDTNPMMAYRDLVGWEQPKQIEDKDENKEKKPAKKRFPKPVFSDPESLSYRDVATSVAHLANNLVGKLGIKGGDNIAIYLETGPEWLQCAHACFKKGIIVATLFASLSEEGVISALKENKPVALFMQASALLGEKRKKLMAILKEVDTVKLKSIVVATRNILDDDRRELNDTKKMLSDVCHIDVYEMSELTKDSTDAETKLPTDDLALIMYTSGTTGIPKGVEITHSNMLSSIGALDYSIGLKKEEDKLEYKYMAYLPLAHILELVAEHIILLRGGTLCYGYNSHTLTRSSSRPTGDLDAFKPTIMVGVPKVFDTIMKAAKEKLNKAPLFVRSILETAIWYKSHIALDFHIETPIWSTLLFKRV